MRIQSGSGTVSESGSQRAPGSALELRQDSSFTLGASAQPREGARADLLKMTSIA